MKVAIVGAGISGLAAAYDLQMAKGFEVILFEKSSNVGGKIQTAREGEFVIEEGPDSIFSVKPWATELICELGMEAELMEPLSSEFSILTKGRLHTVPRALASLIPSASGALEKVGFLSSSAKKRALKESEIGPGHEADQSIASFFRRRFGRAFSELVAEPLLAGTHAGDPEKLSMAALYPAYLGMERDHGSVAQAAAARAHAGGPARKVGFQTLRRGMGSFPESLAHALTDTRVMTSTEVSAVEPSSSTTGVRSLTLKTSEATYGVDHLILAVPASAAAHLLGDIAPAAADALNEIRFVSTAIATLAFPRDAFPRPLHGNGFLVPYGEPLPITGCTWSSNKWSDRAPANLLLLRVFMGRDGGLDIDRFSDEELLTQAIDAITGLLKPKLSAVFSRLDRWPQGLPQYDLGHLDRLAKIDGALACLPISLVGASYRGNSIPDCVRQGRQAASALIGNRQTFGQGPDDPR